MNDPLTVTIWGGQAVKWHCTNEGDPPHRWVMGLSDDIMEWMEEQTPGATCEMFPFWLYVTFKSEADLTMFMLTYGSEVLVKLDTFTGSRSTP